MPQAATAYKIVIHPPSTNTFRPPPPTPTTPHHNLHAQPSTTSAIDISFEIILDNTTNPDIDPIPLC